MTDWHPLRHPHDFYPTPPEGTRALLSVEHFDGSIWEPACGDGAIAKVLVRAGYRVVATDLINRGYGDGGINFLTETAARAKHIVTNPPYGRGLADRFIQHALRLVGSTGGSVAMLLNLASLAHPSRTRRWTANPPANVYILDELACGPVHLVDAAPTYYRYAWLVWKPEHRGRPDLWWLATHRFKALPRRGRR